jgi:hypothetical protein
VSVLGGAESVDLRISLAEDNEDSLVADLESLYTWLRSEPKLAGCVTEDRVMPLPGEMGAVSNALIVSLGSGGTLSVLALSLKAWLSQPRGASIRIHIQGNEGQGVEIAADHISRDQAEGLIRQVIDGGIAGQ